MSSRHLRLAQESPIFRFFALAIFLTAQPIAAQAMRAEAAGDTAGLESVLREAARGEWTVRVRFALGGEREGRVRSVGGGRFSVGPQRRMMADVVSVERRLVRGGGAKGGFLLGTAVGSALAAAVYSGIGEGGLRGADYVLLLLFSVATGALIGGVPGALFGASLHPPDISYVTLWPVPEES